LEGSVFLGNLLEVGAFKAWRDVEKFCKAELDDKAFTVVWDVGIKLDPDILYQDLVSSRVSHRFSSPGRTPGIE